jgi:hypothetical protein
MRGNVLDLSRRHHHRRRVWQDRHVFVNDILMPPLAAAGQVPFKDLFVSSTAGPTPRWPPPRGRRCRPLNYGLFISAIIDFDHRLCDLPDRAHGELACARRPRPRR